MSTTEGMNATKSRLIMFTIWALLFVIYVGMFLVMSEVKAVDSGEARAAAWRCAYILVPLLTAFASFWFIPSTPQSTREAVIPFEKVYGMFGLTAVVHVLVLGYFVLAIVLHRFPLSPDPGDSFSDRVDFGLNLLLFISSLAVLPIGWLLGDASLLRLSDVPSRDEQN
jgi:hypothetical protein